MFGGGGGSPPPASPPPPEPTSPEVQSAQADAMRQTRLRRGRSSTVLAGLYGGSGLGTTSGSGSLATTLGGDR